MKPMMLLLLPVSLIISHQPELHQYTKDRTLGFSPYYYSPLSISKNDNYKEMNNKNEDQSNPIRTRRIPYFTHKKAIPNFQSQVNNPSNYPISSPSYDSLDTTNNLLLNLFERIKCDYKKEEDELLELGRNPGSSHPRFFGLKANIFFGLLSALRGPPGPPGPAGLKGDAGVPATSACITCPLGLTGATGATGPSGIDGANGVDGVDGITGAAGANGADGVPGANGVDGVPGATGLNGIDGANGLVGPIGLPGPEGSCSCPVFVLASSSNTTSI